MSITRGLIIAAALSGVATLASAAPARLTDVQFVAANRCLGLVSSRTLGTSDAAALKAFVSDQSHNRDALAWERADQARDDALSEANRASGERKARLTAERDGACQAYIAPAVQAATSGGAHKGGGATTSHTLP